MCGRYTRRASVEVLADYYGVEPFDEFNDVRLSPLLMHGPVQCSRLYASM